jgi:hypothetical protein
MGAITGLSYSPIWSFNQYRQVQISPPWPTMISHGAGTHLRVHVQQFSNWPWAEFVS